MIIAFDGEELYISCSSSLCDGTCIDTDIPVFYWIKDKHRERHYSDRGVSLHVFEFNVYQGVINDTVRRLTYVLDD